MELITPKKVAEDLFTSKSTLSKWRLKGIGPKFVKIGPRAVAYPKDEIESWLRSNLKTSTSGTGKGGRRKVNQTTAEIAQ